MIPLQGNNTNLQGGAVSLQGGSYNPQQTVSPTYTPPKPTTSVVKPASPSATSTVTPKQQYMNDLSSRYGLNSGTVYDKSTNKALSLDEFKASSGISNPDWKSLKFDTAYSIPSVNSPSAQMFVDSLQKPASAPAAPAVSAPKSAYLEYLRKQFNPEALDAAGNSLNELNKRTSEELLRARAREDEVRKNEIGQIESGLNHNLSENARLSNKSLADLALAKGYAGENYNRLLGFGENLYNLEESERRTKLAEGDATLKAVAPALLEQLGTFKTQAEKDAYIVSKATELGVSIDKVNSALHAVMAAKKQDPITLSEGEAVWDPNTQSFIYKNPKTYDPNSGANGLTPGQINTTVNQIASAFDNEPVVKNFNVVKEGYDYALSIGSKSNPTSTDDQGLIYAFAKAQDPNSVVKEGEYITVQKYSQSLAQQKWADLKRMAKNEPFLTPEARRNMIATIKSKYGASEKAYQNVYNEYQRQINDAYTGAPRTITNYLGAQPGVSPGGGDPLGLGFNRVGNTSASTPYLSKLGPITGLDGSSLWKWGLDIDLKMGQPVPALVGGQVIAVAPNGGFGNQVKIRAADGTEFWYSHLQNGTVKVGQTIQRGQIIGLGGNTGNTIPGPGGDGSHLDLTAKDPQGNYISPRTIAQLARQTFV